MRIALIGCGVIGGVIAEAVRKGEISAAIDLIYDLNQEKARETSRGLRGAKVVEGIEDILDSEVDLVIEAASQEAVRQYALDILRAGKDLMIMSVGALANEDFLKEAKRIAGEKDAKVYIPSGAIGGLDALRSAASGEVHEVSLTTTKPPGSLGLKIKERKVVYEGNAREAIKRFPANINVAAALSLAGLGVNETKVTIIADPKVEKNIHEIWAKGDFGEFHFRVENLPSPENPRTSYLAALSAIAMLKRITSSMEVGN